MNKQRVRRRKHPVHAAAWKRVDIERLVKSGVERFILKDATIHEFLGTLRTASKKESAYRHQITRSVFSRIVKQAISKRKRQLKKPGQS